MRPPTDDTAVALLRRHIPEFEDQYLDLVDIYDEDLTPEIVFMELADYVANLLVSDESEESLERCLAAVEHVVALSGDGATLVASTFVNELPVDPGGRLAATSGPLPTSSQSSSGAAPSSMTTCSQRCRGRARRPPRRPRPPPPARRSRRPLSSAT